MRARPITLMLILTCGLLAGCGFKLQGATELPPEMENTLLVAQDPYSHFVRRLTILLEQNGAQVVGEPPNTAILEIPVNQIRKEILTIGDNAKVREYRLRHRVRFRLLDANGQVIIPEQSLERTRVISFDEQDILAATREEEFLRQELADTLSRLVLRQLGTASA